MATSTVSCIICNLNFRIKNFNCSVNIKRALVFLLSFQVTSGQKIEWSEEDKRSILRRIDNKLGERAVRSQRLNRTTNKCESAHGTVLKSLPKRHAWSRTFKGRVNSGVHSMCVGQTKSEIITNELLGAGNTKHGRAYECRLRLIRKEIYHRDRKRSNVYKKNMSKDSGSLRNERRFTTQMLIPMRQGVPTLL